MNEKPISDNEVVFAKGLFWGVVCLALTLGVPIAFIAADIHSATILRQAAHDKQAKSEGWADIIAKTYTPYPMTGKAY